MFKVVDRLAQSMKRWLLWCWLCVQRLDCDVRNTEDLWWYILASLVEWHLQDHLPYFWQHEAPRISVWGTNKRNIFCECTDIFGCMSGTRCYFLFICSFVDFYSYSCIVTVARCESRQLLFDCLIEPLIIITISTWPFQQSFFQVNVGFPVPSVLEENRWGPGFYRPDAVLAAVSKRWWKLKAMTLLHPPLDYWEKGALLPLC